MAVAVTVVTRGHLGNKKAVVAEVTFDSSYPTGGESFVPADVGLNQFEAVFVSPARASATALACYYDHTNQKIMTFETAATVDLAFDESDNTNNLSSFKAHVLAIGH